MKLLLPVAVFAIMVSTADATPNANITDYCRERSDSFEMMRRCIESEEESRAIIAKKQGGGMKPVDPVVSCVNALVAWDKNNPCPPERWAEIVQALRDHKPCL
jgi:hypothetical protein